jgi:hypothetical protein
MRRRRVPTPRAAWSYDTGARELAQIAREGRHGSAFRHLPEQAFDFVGGMDEVRARAAAG